MSVPDAALNFLLDNLSQIVQYNYHLIADVKDDIESLQKELESLRALMKDFEKYNNDSDSVKNTVKQIRGIVGQAEDAVESYLLQAAVQNARNWVAKTFHQFTDYPLSLRDLGKQVNSIKETIKKIKEENVPHTFDALTLEGINRINQPSQPKEAPKVEEEHVIGFENAADDVQKLLTEGPEHLEIVSIVGMLGLGKTTLAKKVYKDPDVDYEYIIRAFAYVSQAYERKDVFLKILGSFTQVSNAKDMTAEELEKNLRKELEGKQYLIVLDDIWEIGDWDNFKDAFPNNKKRCRVLITTRNEKVAEYANPNKTPYKLDFLTMDNCRELLRWRVFGEDISRNEVLSYEIEIAKKCDGLPLAVVVIAGIIWNHRDNIEWWEEVAKSVKDYIARDELQTTKVIDLMYKHLPNYLKPCFLYLGIFREDIEIPVWKLVRLWIAEGLIQHEGNCSNLEVLADVYLGELVYRNLVMMVKGRSNGKIKTCRMHDTLREFCKKEAAEEDLFQEIKKDESSFSLSGKSSFDKCRRLCLNNANTLEYIFKNPSGKCVRSILTSLKEETGVKPGLIACLPKTFKLLRVLEMESLTLSRFPLDLCNLILLKYISISSDFKSLPPALSNLFCMQTLIVKTSSSTLEIKADIWKLPQFRHLHTNVSTVLPFPKPQNEQTKEEAFASKNVQTLSTIAPKNCKEEVFRRTPNLKKLGISGTLIDVIKANGESSLFDYLCSLEFLENLKLLNVNVASKLYRLPSENSFPSQLKKLTLLNTLLRWEEMSKLGKLEKLEVLKLKENAFGGNLWQTEKGGFRHLKHLYIGCMDLMVWEEASEDHFPALMSLELNSCSKLQAIPPRLAEITSFQSLVLHCTNTSVVSSARRLQVLKLNHEKKGLKDSSFKLYIYPPEL